MDFTRQDEISLKTESSIEVSTEWSNVLTHYHELQKLLNSCNTEARHSWAIIDKVRRSASTVTLELSDLEKELSNDISLLTKNNDIWPSQKSDFNYVKTSCQESFTSLNHSSDSGSTKMTEINNSKIPRLISPLLRYQKNCPYSNKEMNNLDLTQSFQKSDDCNRCENCHELFNDNYLKKLREHYLEKRENVTPKKSDLFTKNNCKPVQSISDISDTSKTSKTSVQLLKKLTLCKLSEETQISNVYYNFVKKSKSADDLSSNSSVKEKSHLDQINYILSEYHKKKLQIKSLSETHIHPARCYYPKFYDKQGVMCRHKPNYRVTYDDDGGTYKEKCCTRCNRIITKQQCDQSKMPKCYEDNDSLEDSTLVCDDDSKKDQDCQTDVCNTKLPELTDCTKLYCTNSGIRNDLNDLSPQKYCPRDSISIKAFTMPAERENKCTGYEPPDVNVNVTNTCQAVPKGCEERTPQFITCEDNCKENHKKPDVCSSNSKQKKGHFDEEISINLTHRETNKVCKKECNKTVCNKTQINVQATPNIYTVDLDDITSTRMYTIPFDRIRSNFVAVDPILSTKQSVLSKCSVGYTEKIQMNAEKEKIEVLKMCTQILASRQEKDKEPNWSNDKKAPKDEASQVSIDKFTRDEIEIANKRPCSDDKNDVTHKFINKKNQEMQYNLPTLYEDPSLSDDKGSSKPVTPSSRQKLSDYSIESDEIVQESCEDMLDILEELNKLSKKGTKIYNKKSNPRKKPKITSQDKYPSEILERKRINRFRHSSTDSSKIKIERKPLKRMHESSPLIETSDESLLPDKPKKLKNLESKYIQATGSKKHKLKEIGVQCDLILKQTTPSLRKSVSIYENNENKSTTTKKTKKKISKRTKKDSSTTKSPSPVKNVIKNKKSPGYISNIPRPIRKKEESHDKTLLWFKTRGITKDMLNYVALTPGICHTKSSCKRYTRLTPCKTFIRKQCPDKIQNPCINLCKSPCRDPSTVPCRKPSDETLITFETKGITKNMLNYVALTPRICQTKSSYRRYPRLTPCRTSVRKQCPSIIQNPCVNLCKSPCISPSMNACRCMSARNMNPCRSQSANPCKSPSADPCRELSTDRCSKPSMERSWKPSTDPCRNSNIYGRSGEQMVTTESKLCIGGREIKCIRSDEFDECEPTVQKTKVTSINLTGVTSDPCLEERTDYPCQAGPNCCCKLPKISERSYPEFSRCCNEPRCPQNVDPSRRSERRSNEQVVITYEEEEPQLPKCNPCLCTPVKSTGIYKENRVSMISEDCDIFSDKPPKKKVSAEKCHAFDPSGNTCGCADAKKDKTKSPENNLKSNTITSVSDKIVNPEVYPCTVNSMECQTEITCGNIPEYMICKNDKDDKDEKILESGDTVEYNYTCACCEDDDEPNIRHLCDSFHNSTIYSIDEEESCECIREKNVCYCEEEEEEEEVEEEEKQEKKGKKREILTKLKKREKKQEKKEEQEEQEEKEENEEKEKKEEKEEKNEEIKEDDHKLCDDSNVCDIETAKVTKTENKTQKSYCCQNVQTEIFSQSNMNRLSNASQTEELLRNNARDIIELLTTSLIGEHKKCRTKNQATSWSASSEVSLDRKNDGTQTEKYRSNKHISKPILTDPKISKKSKRTCDLEQQTSQISVVPSTMTLYGLSFPSGCNIQPNTEQEKTEITQIKEKTENKVEQKISQTNTKNSQKPRVSFDIEDKKFSVDPKFATWTLPDRRLQKEEIVFTNIELLKTQLPAEEEQCSSMYLEEVSTNFAKWTLPDQRTSLVTKSLNPFSQKIINLKSKSCPTNIQTFGESDTENSVKHVKKDLCIQHGSKELSGSSFKSNTPGFNDSYIMPVLIETNKSLPHITKKPKKSKNLDPKILLLNCNQSDSKKCKSQIEGYVKSVDNCIKINNDFLSGIKPINPSFEKEIEEHRKNCPAEKAFLNNFKRKKEDRPEIIVTVEVQSDNLSFIPTEKPDEKSVKVESEHDTNENSDTKLNQNLYVQKAECNVKDIYIPTYLASRHRNQWIKYQNKKSKSKNIPKEKTKKPPINTIDKNKKKSKTKRTSKKLYKNESDESMEECKIEIQSIEKSLEFKQDLKKFPHSKFPCEILETESYDSYYDEPIKERQVETATDSIYKMDEVTQTNKKCTSGNTTTEIKSSTTVSKISAKSPSNSCVHFEISSESEKSILSGKKVKSNRIIDVPCIEMEDNDSEVAKTRVVTPNLSNPNEEKFDKLELSYLNQVKKRLDQIRAKSLKSQKVSKAEQKQSERDSMKAIMDILFNILSPPLPEKDHEKTVKSISDKEDINIKKKIPEKLGSTKNIVSNSHNITNKESKEILTHVRRNKTATRIINRNPRSTDTSIMSSIDINSKNNSVQNKNKPKIKDKKEEEDCKCFKCAKVVKQVRGRKCLEVQPETKCTELKNTSSSCQITTPKSNSNLKTILKTSDFPLSRKNPWNGVKLRKQISSIPESEDEDDIRESKKKTINFKKLKKSSDTSLIKTSKMDKFYESEPIKKFINTREKRKRVSEILDTNEGLNQDEIRSKLKPQKSTSKTKINTKTPFPVQGKEDKINQNKKIPTQIEKSYVSRGISVCLASNENLKVIKSLINMSRSKSPSPTNSNKSSPKVPKKKNNKPIQVKEIKDPNKKNDNFTKFRIINKLSQPKNRSQSLPSSLNDKKEKLSHPKEVSRRILKDLKNFKILNVNQEPVPEKKFTFKKKKDIDQHQQDQNRLNIHKSKLKELNDLLDDRTPWLRSLKTFEKMKDEIKRPNSNKDEICTCESNDYFVRRSPSKKITLEKASVYKPHSNYSKKSTNKYQKSSQSTPIHSKISRINEISYEQEIWKRKENDIYDKSENIFDKIAMLNSTDSGNISISNKSISNLTYTINSKFKNKSNSIKKNRKPTHIEYEIKYKDENNIDLNVLETVGKWQMTPSMEEVMNQGFICKNKKIFDSGNKLNKLASKSRKDFIVMPLKTQKIHRFGSASYKNLLSTIAKSEEPYISGLKTKKKKEKCNAEGDVQNCDRFDSYFNTLSEISSLPPNKKHLTKLEDYIKALKKLTKKLKRHLITVKIALDRDNLLPKNEERHKDENQNGHQKEGLNTLIHIHQELNNLTLKINETKFMDFKNGAFNMIKNKTEQERLIKINQFELAKMKSIEKQIQLLDKDILNQINIYNTKYLNDTSSLKEEALVQMKQEKLAETKMRLNAKLNEIHKLIVYQIQNQSNKATNSDIKLRKKLEHIGEVLKNELSNINTLIKVNREE